MPRLDKFTTSFQNAIMDAKSIAVSLDNQVIEPLHVMKALLEQDSSSVAPILNQSGVTVSQLGSKLQQALERLPKVEGTGGDIMISHELDRLLNVMDKMAHERGYQLGGSVYPQRGHWLDWLRWG